MRRHVFQVIQFFFIGAFLSVCLCYRIGMTWSQNIWTGRMGYQFVYLERFTETLQLWSQCAGLLMERHPVESSKFFQATPLASSYALWQRAYWHRKIEWLVNDDLERWGRGLFELLSWLLFVGTKLNHGTPHSGKLMIPPWFEPAI